MPGEARVHPLPPPPRVHMFPGERTAHRVCLGWCWMVLGGAGCKEPFPDRGSCRCAGSPGPRGRGLSISPSPCLTDWGFLGRGSFQAWANHTADYMA